MTDEQKKSILNSVEAFLSHVDNVEHKVTGFFSDFAGKAKESITIIKEEDGFSVKFNTKIFK